MKSSASLGRPSVATRQVGYMITAVVNAAVLYLVNAWPGWEAVPFLTSDTRQVVALLNLSLIAGLVINLTYAAYDQPWWRAFGEVLTAMISLAVLTRIWRVFPFDFGDSAADWALLVRFVLVAAIVGTAIGAVAHLVGLVRSTLTAGR